MSYSEDVGAVSARYRPGGAAASVTYPIGYSRSVHQSLISETNEIPGSQTGSLRRQTSGDAG